MRKQDKSRIISAKDLGALALPDFCPRCFWIERRFGKPPGIFPGIFSTLDAVTKRSVHSSFKDKDEPPSWLNISGATGVEEGDIYFKLPMDETGWILVGKPDDIFKLKDETYHIVDYKTAKFTGRQDELFPMYEVQLNSYAFLAEKYGFKIKEVPVEWKDRDVAKGKKKSYFKESKEMLMQILRVKLNDLRGLYGK